MNELKQKDLESIVKIHLETLSEDLLPQLGEKFLIKFYEYINNSEFEEIFYSKDKDKLLATCIISYDPNTLLSRVLKKTLINFIYSFTVNILTNKKLFISVFKIFFNKTNFISKSPEITYIFTDPKLKGKGIGKEIILKVENSLKDKNINTYYVKTINGKENKAISFYLKNGFEKFEKFNYAGNSYLYLKKCLNV